MEIINQKSFSGERALYGAKNLRVEDSVFENGESPFKEASNIELDNCLFRWKYPFWYCNDVKVTNCTWFDMARAGVWYTKNMSVNNAQIQAPKNFRRCEKLSLENVTMTNAAETLWSCKGVKLKNVSAKGDYFAMNSSDMEIDNFYLDGNYSFDGCKNLTVRNSRLTTKDAFWNSENVTVIDSTIMGEYLGWNSKNLTLINCTIESLQGMCYIENLVMKNCKLINTTLAFENCTMDAQIVNKIDSVFNPISGTIEAAEIDELIVEKDLVDETKTKIVCAKINKRSDKPEWKA
ncbi:MAG: DUF3737 family protein [Lachnospiraceae bacterium]|nr:DUF3737 family protein [Lachnospiraceae bacterium]